MPGGKKDGGRGQNGNRAGFRTDAAISNSRFGQERVLQPWVPEGNDPTDGSLEKSTNTSGWDQFAENKRLFGVTTDYDENYYTTAIDKSHPQYRERMAQADRKAREIERSDASTAHVAEERVMDYVASGKNNGDENEEDKYSGVRRQDFPPLGGARENKYTPPAKRAPMANSTIKGAPVDPAIISSQIKATSTKPTPPPEEPTSRNAEPSKNGVTPQPQPSAPAQPQRPSSEDKGKVDSGMTMTDVKASEQTNASGRTSASGNRNAPQAKEKPSATDTVETDVYNSFKEFAVKEREFHQKQRSSKAKADKQTKLAELRQFGNSFKLATPVPGDLVSIIAKDPVKQQEIQARAIKDAAEVAQTKREELLKKASPSKDASAKPDDSSQSTAASENRGPRGPNAPTVAPQMGNRHPRQPFNQPFPYRNHRQGPQQMYQQQHTGTLSQRLRNVEQQKHAPPSAAHQLMPRQDGQVPPTGPANNADPNANRRLSGVPPSVGLKLNPNSHEFRPNASAPSFNPAGHPSASSSPRSVPNNANGTPAPATAGGSILRRKTKAVDPKKCNILAHVKTLTPPQGRNWDDNSGLRPSYDTLPTWRQLKDDEKPDSTMHLTYKEYFDRRPFTSTMATPNTGHVLPHAAHQHQLPFHLQQGGQGMGPRQSPHMGHLQAHAPQHGPVPHQPYGHEDHRMVHSNSAQSFASPRMGHASMAYPGMGSPAQMPYNQPMLMGPGGPQMNQFRSFSNNPNYMPPQHGQMGGPMMMQPHFMPGPQGMGGPHMMYPGGNPHFMPPGGPPQGGPGANGYPSPGRPSAPMMAHQGSQQGQPMYGMSPNVQHSQPNFGPGQQPPGGPMPQPRGSNTGSQRFGSSSQQGPHHAAQRQQRSGSHTYSRTHSAQGQQQSESGGNATSATSSQARGPENPGEPR